MRISDWSSDVCSAGRRTALELLLFEARFGCPAGSIDRELVGHHAIALMPGPRGVGFEVALHHSEQLVEGLVSNEAGGQSIDARRSAAQHVGHRHHVAGTAPPLRRLRRTTIRQELLAAAVARQLVSKERVCGPSLGCCHGDQETGQRKRTKSAVEKAGW